MHGMATSQCVPSSVWSPFILPTDPPCLEWRDFQGLPYLSAGRAPEELLQDGNPLMMLLRTLLPWFNPGQQPDYEQEDQDGGQQGGGQ